ncbi:MAG: tRNA (uridine(54)-C5)-methyltransferase TrmA, partial [Sulfurimonas sp.]|nr:tRNA (uridine(54)-C5)-methyltransferase TrmA [Sulfurimonas sp.]
MECKYFGQCGSCRLYEDGYESQLEAKKKLNQERFKPFYGGNIAVYKSPESHYRSRSEFKIWHLDEKIHYAMNHLQHKGALIIEECPQVNEHITKIMPLLLDAIEEEAIGFKLFGADFLSASSGEMVVS